MLPLLLTGCFHRTHQPPVEVLAPPILDAPPPKPASAPTDLPPPVVTVPGQNETSGANAEPQKPPVRHRKPPASSTQQASNEAPGASTPSTPGPSSGSSGAAKSGAGSSGGVSAIGHFSSGDPSELRQQTLESIVAVERGLNGISRRLGDQEQKTAAQIREYLKQAKAALASGDVDGAHTLAAKAKVLLSELSQ